MIFHRKRIRKRNRQRKDKRPLLFLFSAITLSGVIALIVFFAQHRFRLITPLPKIGMVQISGSDAGNAFQEKIKHELVKKGINIADIKLTSSDAIVALQSGEEVTFSRQKDLSSQIASLQVIITQLTMVGKRFSKLDLRFDKPVIVLK